MQVQPCIVLSGEGIEVPGPDLGRFGGKERIQELADSGYLDEPAWFFPMIW